MEKLGKIFLFILGVITLTFLLASLYALPAMLLWNWLIPLLFGGIEITFLQAFGLIFLSRLFFHSTTFSNKQGG